MHGNGVNIDNLETRDERQLVPGICFSIEPGIYLAGEMAVRTEINVFITSSRQGGRRRTHAGRPDHCLDRRTM